MPVSSRSAKSSGAIAEKTRILAYVLKEVSPGGTITFDTMSAVTGLDIRKQCNRPLIYAAMDIAKNESGAVFDSIYGQGYRRVIAAEAHTLGVKRRSQVRRAVRITSDRINAATKFANDMPGEAQRRISKEIAALGIIEMMTMESAVRKIEEHDNGRPLSVAEIGKRLFE